MKFVRKIKPFFIDERGEMSYLLDNSVSITSALYITCKKGSIRANHYHKKDTHYSYMLKGRMEYTYKNVKSQNSKVKIRPDTVGTKRKTIIVNAGEIVETPPMTVHAMRFLEDSVFLALTTESRDQDKYERDTIRVKLI